MMENGYGLFQFMYSFLIVFQCFDGKLYLYIMSFPPSFSLCNLFWNSCLIRKAKIKKGKKKLADAPWYWISTICEYDSWHGVENGALISVGIQELCCWTSWLYGLCELDNFEWITIENNGNMGEKQWTMIEQKKKIWR